MDRTIRTCSCLLAAALLLPGVAWAKGDDIPAESALFWQAQRAELGGKQADALKTYVQLVGKIPTSAVAADRLYAAALVQGDFSNALKAARAQQLSDGGDATLPIVFFTDAWNRKDWKAARGAAGWLEERGIFGFMAPILAAWVDVAETGKGQISNSALRESGLLAYYSNDQQIYLYIASGHIDAAKRRLGSFPGFGDDYARHMAIIAAEYFGRNGEADYANSILDHIGLDPVAFGAKPSAFEPNTAISALFSRMSDQLEEQNLSDQALGFARFAQWIAPTSPYAAITLSKRLTEWGQGSKAQSLLDSISPQRPQWSWALTYKAGILRDSGRADDALKLVRLAHSQRSNSRELTQLEAQQLWASEDRSGAADLYRKLISDADSKTSNQRKVTYRLLLAQTLYGGSQWPEARAALEEALRIDGNNANILNMLGYGLLERREDVKRGFELVAKAHRLAPQSAAITDSLGWGHYLNGEYDKAVALLEQAVEGALSDVTINEHLGDAYWKVGRTIEARYAWRAASLQADGDAAERLSAKIDFGWTEATASP